jgi:hypothetical protein
MILYKNISIYADSHLCQSTVQYCTLLAMAFRLYLDRRNMNSFTISLPVTRYRMFMWKHET